MNKEQILGWLFGDIDKRYNKNFKIILVGIEFLSAILFLGVVLLYPQFNDFNKFENWKSTIRNLEEGRLMLCFPEYTSYARPINGTDYGSDITRKYFLNQTTDCESRLITLGNYTIPNPNPIHPIVSKLAN
jgi:hypothetical protein